VTREKCEEAKTRALSGYLDPGPNHLNCAQAVLTGAILATDDDPELKNIANYFGGGMARMGEACGALTGAAIAFGLRDLRRNGEMPKNTGFDPMQRLMRDFEEKFGAITCKGLLGCDISTSEGFRAAKKCKALDRCPAFVTWTLDRLSEVICEEGR
jgi:C_GCAxxG_C_C family probable redox protein